jgi:Zn-dependent protease
MGLTCHEYAHGWAANRLGDDTAARAGRLTFNPFKHMDLLGTLVLLMTSFIGWAKPVPVDPRNFRNPMRDMSLVALAGPAANFILAFILAMGFKLGFFEWFLALFPSWAAEPLASMCFLGVLINLGLAIFNMIPWPPLDGFNIVAYFLPSRLVYEIHRYSFIGFIILLIMSATGMLRPIISPIFTFFAKVLLS